LYFFIYNTEKRIKRKKRIEITILIQINLVYDVNAIFVYIFYE